MEAVIARAIGRIMLRDDGKYLRLNEDELLEKVQPKGEQVWDSVPKWHWTGKSVDEVVPPAFKMN